MDHPFVPPDNAYDHLNDDYDNSDKEKTQRQCRMYESHTETSLFVFSAL
jgi:hypothetical protein